MAKKAMNFKSKAKPNKTNPNISVAAAKGNTALKVKGKPVKVAHTPVRKKAK